MKWFFKATAISVALGIAAFAIAGNAGASHVKVDLSVPSQPTIGQ